MDQDLLLTHQEGSVVKKLRLDNAVGQAGVERKSLGQCPEQSRQKSSIIKLPLFLAYTFPPPTPSFPSTLVFVFFFSPCKQFTNLDNTALSQTALQQALLGGQESAAQDEHPGPDFIIWGIVICLHNHVSDDNRVCLVQIT